MYFIFFTLITISNIVSAIGEQMIDLNNDYEWNSVSSILVRIYRVTKHFFIFKSSLSRIGRIACPLIDCSFLTFG